MHQTFQWIHVKSLPAKKFANTSAAYVPQFVGFSCFGSEVMLWTIVQLLPDPQMSERRSNTIVGSSSIVVITLYIYIYIYIYVSSFIMLNEYNIHCATEVTDWTGCEQLMLKFLSSVECTELVESFCQNRKQLLCYSKSHILFELHDYNQNWINHITIRC